MSTSRFHSLAFGLILAVGVLLYGRTLPYPFVFDDYIYLVGNPLIKDARSFVYHGDFRSFATYSARVGLDPDLSTNFILRPVTYLTFYINYTLDGVKPRGFRAVNIAIHCANAMFILLVLARLLRTSSGAGTLPKYSSEFIALAVALLFLVHPLQTESVTYIVQRFTSLAAFFALLTMLTYFRANAAENPLHRRLWRCLSLAALVIGMLSKESVFMVPFLLTLLDWLVMGTPLKQVGKRLIPYAVCLPLIPVLILLTSWAQNSGNANLSAAFHIASDIKDPHYQWCYALTQPSVLLSYLGLILVPRHLNIDRDYPVFTSLLQEPVWFSLVVIAVLFVSGWLMYRRQPGDVRRSLCFCSLIWFFLVMMPSSSLVPLPDRMAEHRCYLATMGALTAVICLLDMWRTSFVTLRWMRVTVPACVAAWGLVLCAATWSRNEVWSSEISLWKDTTEKSPRKFRPWMNLGTAYVENGRLKEAVRCFWTALQIEPRLIPGFENLSATENALHNYREALHIASAGLQCAPGSAKICFNHGVALCGLGQVEKGAESLRRALKNDPCHLQSRLALALCYGRLGQHEQALKQVEVAMVAAPNDALVLQTKSQIDRLVHRQDHASKALFSR